MCQPNEITIQVGVFSSPPQLEQNNSSNSFYMAGASEGKFALDGRGSQRESTVEMRNRSARQLTRKPLKDGPGRRIERHLRHHRPLDEATQADPAAEVVTAANATGSLDAASSAVAPTTCDGEVAPAAASAACSAAAAAPQCPAARQRRVNIAPVSQSAPANEPGDSSVVQRSHAHAHAHAHPPELQPSSLCHLSPHLSTSHPISSFSPAARLW